MFKRILVPLDGSARAEVALPLAARLARPAGGAVVLARVVSPPTQHRFDFVQPAPPDTLLAATRDMAERYLEEVVGRDDLADVTTQVAVVEASAVAPALLDVMRTSHADLMIICSHGGTGLLRWTLGSVAQKIARQATVPTLVLHADGPILLRTPDDTYPVGALAPLDGSPEAEAALEPAARLISALAAPAQGALHLLHVVQVEDVTGARQPVDAAELDGQQSLLREADSYLRSVAERFKQEPLASLKVHVTWSVAFDPDVAAAIIAETVSERVDETARTDSGARIGYAVVAMASHGRSGFQLWALGSVTDRVLQSSKLPLLIVRPPDVALSQTTVHVAEERQTDSEISGWPGY